MHFIGEKRPHTLEQSVTAIFSNQEVQASDSIINKIAKGIAEKYVDENYPEVQKALNDSSKKIISNAAKEAVKTIGEAEKAVAISQGNNSVAVVSNKGNIKIRYGIGNWEDLGNPW